MTCKTIDIEPITQDTYEIEEESQTSYEFEYCISYRDPALDEWILARGVWNDKGIWTAEGKFL